MTLALVFVCYFFLKNFQGQKLASDGLDRDRTEDETSTEALKLKVQEKSVCGICLHSVPRSNADDDDDDGGGGGGGGGGVVGGVGGVYLLVFNA